MKLKIDSETLINDFFENSFLLGIVAPVKDYHFIWNINQTLGYHFVINHGIEIQLRKKERNYFFSIYQHLVTNSDVAYYLYNNEDDGEFLLPEFKHLDYLMLVKGEGLDETDSSVLQKSLKCLHGVQLVNEMTNEKIKNKLSLIF